MANFLETILESLASIPGLGFLEQHANSVRSARHTVRDHRERGEELAARGKLVKDTAAGGGSDASKSGATPKPTPKAKAAEQSVRSQQRGRSKGGFEAEAGPKNPSSRLTPDSEKNIRDTSPQRDQGRSLRKRKDNF